MLAKADSTKVPAIVRRFLVQTSDAQFARLRNGDLSGGIELCSDMEPGVGAPWRDAQIEHAKLRYGGALSTTLSGFLRRGDLEELATIGALRLAGHIGDPSLSLAIEVCWKSDVHRNSHLADYLWAYAECCGDEPARFLGPVCEAWAAISNVPEKEGWDLPRENFAGYELRWAFQRWPPAKALDYLVQRGGQPDLNSPMAILLTGVDHPKAVDFVVRESAAMQRGIGKIWTDYLSIDYWQRAQKDKGRPMSEKSRIALFQLWNNEDNDRYIRSEAFSVWAATRSSNDLTIIMSARPSVELADNMLAARLIREDRTAIVEMIEKLRGHRAYWWQFGRYVWSSDLTEALDETLRVRGDRATRIWGETFQEDTMTHEMVMRLSIDDGERLLIAHWDHLRFAPAFVQTALYVATPKLLLAAQTAIGECPQPTLLFAKSEDKLWNQAEGAAGSPQ